MMHSIRCLQNSMHAHRLPLSSLSRSLLHALRLVCIHANAHHLLALRHEMSDGVGISCSPGDFCFVKGSLENEKVQFRNPELLTRTWQVRVNPHLCMGGSHAMRLGSQ